MQVKKSNATNLQILVIMKYQSVNQYKLEHLMHNSKMLQTLILALRKLIQQEFYRSSHVRFHTVQHKQIKKTKMLSTHAMSPRDSCTQMQHALQAKSTIKSRVMVTIATLKRLRPTKMLKQ